MMQKTVSWITRKLNNFLQFNEHQKTTLFYLSLSFFFIIGSYSILRSLKTSIFLGFVGKEYQPIVKMLNIIITVPAMLFYAKLTDKLKRYQVTFFLLLLYALIGITFACIFMHPVYGVKNNITSIYRLTGWAFEIFMDLYQAFVVGSFWSFINSISTPQFANKAYGIIYATSRLGGILSTGIGLIILAQSAIKDYHSIPLLTFLASLFLIAAAYFIYKIIQKIPAEHLKGYASLHGHEQENKTQKKQGPGVFEGLRLMLTEPYVFGIFGLVACFEITNIVLDYQMQVLMSIETHNNIKAMSHFMLLYTNSFQALGFLFALFGTTTLIEKIGVLKCLLIMPIVVCLLSVNLFFHPSLSVIFFTMVTIRALQYGFNSPLREVLYIPTIKDVQFKSKAWIDSFGRTFSKSSGSAFNLFSILQSSSLCVGIQSIFTFSITLLWLIIAVFMGKKYNKTIQHNEVIGYEKNIR